MSYQKAMKHARNVRKQRKQSRMYFGFDTGSGRWPSIWSLTRDCPRCGYERPTVFFETEGGPCNTCEPRKPERD